MLLLQVVQALLDENRELKHMLDVLGGRQLADALVTALAERDAVASKCEAEVCGGEFGEHPSRCFKAQHTSSCLHQFPTGCSAVASAPHGGSWKATPRLLESCVLLCVFRWTVTFQLAQARAHLALATAACSKAESAVVLLRRSVQALESQLQVAAGRESRCFLLPSRVCLFAPAAQQGYFVEVYNEACTLPVARPQRRSRQRKMLQ